MIAEKSGRYSVQGYLQTVKCWGDETRTDKHNQSISAVTDSTIHKMVYLSHTLSRSKSSQLIITEGKIESKRRVDGPQISCFRTSRNGQTWRPLRRSSDRPKTNKHSQNNHRCLKGHGIWRRELRNIEHSSFSEWLFCINEINYNKI